MPGYRPVWLLEPQPDPQPDGGEGPTLVVGAMTDQDILVAARTPSCRHTNLFRFIVVVHNPDRKHATVDSQSWPG
jgi:hypothetical protein